MYFIYNDLTDGFYCSVWFDGAIQLMAVSVTWVRAGYLDPFEEFLDMTMMDSEN